MDAAKPYSSQSGPCALGRAPITSRRFSECNAKTRPRLSSLPTLGNLGSNLGETVEGTAGIMPMVPISGILITKLLRELKPPKP